MNIQEDVQIEKIVTELEEQISGKDATEMVLTCSFKTAEKIRYKMMNKGFKAELYEDLGELKIGLWRNK